MPVIFFRLISQHSLLHKGHTYNNINDSWLPIIYCHDSRWFVKSIRNNGIQWQDETIPWRSTSTGPFQPIYIDFHVRCAVRPFEASAADVSVVLGTDDNDVDFIIRRLVLRLLLLIMTLVMTIMVIFVSLIIYNVLLVRGILRTSWMISCVIADKGLSHYTTLFRFLLSIYTYLLV